MSTSTCTESQNAQDIPTLASDENTENISDVVTDSKESEFNRAAIDKLGNRVRITDTDEENNLELMCYVRCGPEDSGLIRQCRGVVFHDTDIVMCAFPYTVEFSTRDENLIRDNIETLFGECSFYDAYEGALIRMFNFNGKWYISTHRKLNAFRSKWSSKESFGTCFKRALEAEIENNDELRNSLPSNDNSILERFQSTLDPEKQYMFLVCHNEENRIVCAVPSRPTLYHVGTFVNGVLEMTENINIPYPRKHTFLDIQSLLHYVQNIDIRNLQGVIIFAPDNRQFKVLHDDYIEFFRVRGNEPSIKYRYLQVRMNSKMVDMLYHLYPNMCDTFDEYENIIYAIAKNIHTSYIQRHIKNKWSTLPTEEYAVDRACHSWHEADRKNNRVNIDKVIEVLNEQSATNLNKMIRRFREEKLKQKESQNMVQTRNRSNTVTSTTYSPVINEADISPLLLSKNRKRNNTTSPNLGPAAPCVVSETHVLSEYENK